MINYILLSMVFFTISIPIYEKENQSFELGEEVNIPFYSLATLNDKGTTLVFQFTDLIEESRCPPKATCIWAGLATIELKVDNVNSFALSHGDLSRRSQGPMTNTATYLGYKIYLKKVSYFQDTDYRMKGKYTITIKVEKEKNQH
ncbi:hypothetical protein ACOCEA_17300 [Maribacter sp. CXY002]|uniref:hypothetical protein n=1 Tax=Maribacter luteocoastalis TaxID=3407671 RepID=UPI003B66B1B9